MAAPANRMPSYRYRSSAASPIPFEVRTAATPRVSARRAIERASSTLPSSNIAWHKLAAASRFTTQLDTRLDEKLSRSSPPTRRSPRPRARKCRSTRQGRTDIQTQQAVWSNGYLATFAGRAGRPNVIRSLRRNS